MAKLLISVVYTGQQDLVYLIMNIKHMCLKIFTRELQSKAY
jgi:hypothetical protein